MMLSFPVSNWGGGSIIKSIQTAEITIAANTSSNTATISAVNTNFAAAFFGGFRSANATATDASQQYVRIDLTNATTVTAQTAAADVSNARIARFTVVEFQPWAVRSIQASTIVLNAVTTNTATINAVTTANAFVVWLGQTHSTNAADFNYTEGTVELTNATTVTAGKGNSATNALTVGFVVIEFYTGILKSNQQVSATIAGSSASQTATISSVNTANSLTVYNGWNLGAFASNDNTRRPYTVLTNGTTVTFSRNSSATSTTCLCKATVLEFQSRYVKRKASGQTTIPTLTASQTATITGVLTGKTLVSWLGFQDNSSDSTNPAAAYPTASLTNSTTVTLTRGTAAGASIVNPSWEAFEFV